MDSTVCVSSDLLCAAAGLLYVAGDATAVWSRQDTDQYGIYDTSFLRSVYYETHSTGPGTGR